MAAGDGSWQRKTKRDDRDDTNPWITWQAPVRAQNTTARCVQSAPTMQDYEPSSGSAPFSQRAVLYYSASSRTSQCHYVTYHNVRGSQENEFLIANTWRRNVVLVAATVVIQS